MSKPTVLQPSSIGVRTLIEKEKSLPVAMPAIVVTAEEAVMRFPVTLSPEQHQQVLDAVHGLDFLSMSQLEIAQLGSDADKALTDVLDTFLSRIERVDDPRIFALFEKLGQDVDDAKLHELADKILDGKLSFGDRLKGFFSKKALANAVRRARDDLDALVRSSTHTLRDKIDQSARDLDVKMNGLRSEVATLEELKQAYRERLSDFIVTAALTRAFVEVNRGVVAEAEAELAQTTNPSVEQQAHVDDLRAKLQTAESCAVSKEATLTKLPADQLVIKQIQDAGIATFVETLTTATARFNNIKMTLLTIHGGLRVKDVQDLAKAGAALDANLAKVRGRLVSGVVTVAANAPGDSRIAQAEQIKGIIAEVGAVQKIVTDARTTNQVKFANARKILEESRQQMVTLATAVCPQVSGKF